MALIVALIVGTTYWQTWARPGLAARQDNEIQRVAEFQVRRGLILAPERVLARNRVVKRNGKTLTSAATRKASDRARRRLLDGRKESRRVEKSMNGVLMVTQENLASPSQRQLDQAWWEADRRDTMVTTLDVHARAGRARAAGSDLRRRGRARSAEREAPVMASSPSYNPNLVETQFSKIAKITADCRPAVPPSTARRRVSTPRARRSGGDGLGGPRPNRFAPDSSSSTPATASRTASGSTTSTRAARSAA